LTDKLLTGFKTKIKGFTLIPSSGGCFEISVNGELIYSKLKTGQFPDEAAIVKAVSEKMGR
jgi:selenoprotein W-related protein